jgi:hypothetical protein
LLLDAAAVATDGWAGFVPVADCAGATFAGAGGMLAGAWVTAAAALIDVNGMMFSNSIEKGHPPIFAGLPESKARNQ